MYLDLFKQIFGQMCSNVTNVRTTNSTAILFINDIVTACQLFLFLLIVIFIYFLIFTVSFKSEFAFFR